jgi:hypothetical protein
VSEEHSLVDIWLTDPRDTDAEPDAVLVYHPETGEYVLDDGLV